MKTTGRYEIRKVLGEGGMGVVYRAFDPVMKREVTVKTIRNHQDKTALEMFKREVSVLGGMAHPNIVEVYDVGETDEADDNRPYFVMPLLRGTTLDHLIRDSSTRLTPERGVQIIAQVCRGVQAAHESGLIHRDIKPSNIFVLEDDSVKVIDFGVAHLIDQRTVTGLKGTAQYMAPEQLQLKAPTPLADQFSIAVVCYELLSKRHPFKVPGYQDLAQAIINHVPAAICDLNPSVNRLISQVVHKALAKEPVHRFSDVREFAESLQKALRNEPIGMFDPAKIEPRLERARKAVSDGDLEFAGEIIRELEAESCLHPEINILRQTINTTKRRKQVQQLLETAKKRFEEGEYLLALQKIQDVITLEPDNTEALTLSVSIEDKRSMAQVEGLLRLAQQHMDNHAYDLAKQSAGKVLQLRPKDPRATSLLTEAERREQESSRVRQEKEKGYRSALQALELGDVSAALSKMERVLDLERSRPDASSPDQSNTYQKLYEDVRTKHDWLDAQYAEARRLASDGNLLAALAICDKVLAQYPNHVVFHALKYEVDDSIRDEISTYIAKVEKEVTAEPDLNQKVSILEAAKEKYPGEDRFKQSLERVRARRNLVHGIAGRAAALENSGQFGEALAQWEILKNTYPQYPGLEIEIERLKARREQQKLAEAKASWVAQIDRELGLNSFARAEALADDALAEYADDPELLSLRRNAQLGLKRIDEAQQKLAEGVTLLTEGKQEEGFGALREASKLDPQSHAARNKLMEELLRRARLFIDSDRAAAESMVSEALQLDPGNSLAKSLRTLLHDKSSSEEISAARSKARELQFEGDIVRAIEVVDETLDKYPNNDGLAQLRSSLLSSLGEAERARIREQDLAKLQELAERSEVVADSAELQSIFSRTQAYKNAYSGDSDFLSSQTRIEQRMETVLLTVPQANEGPSVQDPPLMQEKPAAPTARGPGWKAGISGFFASVSDWVTSHLRSPKPVWRIAGIGAGMLMATLLILGIAGALGGSKDPPKTPPPPPRDPGLVKIALDDATNERVLDSNRNDVTGISQSQGLSAGLYYLTGSKPGFRALNQSFTVDPTQGSSLRVLAKWQPLTTLLNIQQGAPNPLDKWMLDEMPLTSEQLAHLEVPKDGPHELVMLSQGSHKIRLLFTIAGGYPAGSIEVKVDPEIKAMSGVALSVGRDGGQVRGMNVGGVRRADSKEDLDTKAESIPWPQGTEVPLEAKNTAPLGTVPRHDPADGGLIYIYLFVQPDGKPITTQPVAPPPPPPLPTITEFTAGSTSPEHLKPVTFRWAVTNASNASIDNGIGDIRLPSGNLSVIPPALGSYTYTLTASNSAGAKVSRSFTLTVTENEQERFCSNPANKKMLGCGGKE